MFLIGFVDLDVFFFIGNSIGDKIVLYLFWMIGLDLGCCEILNDVINIKYLVWS